MSHPLKLIENLCFANRLKILALFVVLTLFFLYSLFSLKVDSGFTKLLPLKHEYMQTFMQYHEEFGGANRVMVALMVKQGDIFAADYFKALKEITDEVFFIPGVRREQIQSLFTPNVRFMEVVEEGISGGNVIPDQFVADEAGLAQVRENIYKAGIIGRLVANDFTGSLISAQLQEIDPQTGKKLDYFAIAKQLETIRSQYQQQYPNLQIHIIGYTKYISDIADGARQMIWFFLFTIVIITLLVIYYSQDFLTALIPIVCSLCAVIWQLGLLPLLGFGMDPMSILVPFLIFAIGVSHGVQMISRIKYEVYFGKDAEQAARSSFQTLLLPGIVALLSDTLGFITILLINVGIIREMAITASIGVAVIIISNLFILPLLASYLTLDKRYVEHIQHRVDYLIPIWRRLSATVQPGMAKSILILALLISVVSLSFGVQITIGDQQAGVPELHANSVYNRDSATISDRFSIGVDILTVITEAKVEACIDHKSMKAIDNFSWYMKNTEGVKMVLSLPKVAKRINIGWNEGNLKWRELSRNSSVLSQSVAHVPTSTGLLNSDCSVMPVMLFLEDHKQQTIERVVNKIKAYQTEHNDENVHFRLATGNVGVMAASNEEVKRAQFPILLYLYLSILLLCLFAFRSFAAVVIILTPLIVVSLMCYAMMSLLQIGLKVNTLPVVALGIGIGVDYGIYLFSRLKEQLRELNDMKDATEMTYATTGYSILFTGITLSIGVITWVFSPLKFQMDMGILLVFMFFMNMLAALFIIPALSSLLWRNGLLRV